MAPKVVLLLFLVGCAALPAAEKAGRVLAEKFFRPSDFTRVALSPDGTHVSYLVTKPNTLHTLGLLEIATGKIRTAGRDKDDHVMQALWLDAENLIVAYRQKGNRTSNLLITMPRATLEGRMVVDYATQILSVPRNAPAQPWIHYRFGMLAGLQIDGLGKLSPKKEGKDRNLIRVLEAPTLDAMAWLKDPDGELRGCVTYAKDGAVAKVHWRPDLAKTDWVAIPFDWKTTRPLVFNRKGEMLVTAVEDQKSQGLHLLDPTRGQLGPCLYRDEQQNIHDPQVFFSARGTGLAGVRYDRDRPVTVWFDPAMRGLQEFVDRQLPSVTNEIMGWDDAQSVFLIHSSGDEKPGTLLALDLKTRKLKALGEAYPAVEAKALAPTQVVRFTTRDGLDFQGFLTLPRSTTAERPAPLVVFISERPWERAMAGYSAMAQWLADNGFACLRSDQRGSPDFPGEAGLARAADLRGAARDRLDGVHAALKTGLIDPQRVAVVGSYLGARVALGAIGEEPALFRSAVLINGAYDQETYLDYLKENSPSLHRAVEQQIRTSPAAAESFRGLKPIGDLSGLKMATLLTYDAPIDDVAKNGTWASWTHRGSAFVSRAFKKAGAANEVRPISDEHGEAFDRHVTLMAGVGEFLKEKL